MKSKHLRNNYKLICYVLLLPHILSCATFKEKKRANPKQVIYDDTQTNKQEPPKTQKDDLDEYQKAKTLNEKETQEPNNEKNKEVINPNVDNKEIENKEIEPKEDEKTETKTESPKKNIDENLADIPTTQKENKTLDDNNLNNAEDDAKTQKNKKKKEKKKKKEESIKETIKNQIVYRADKVRINLEKNNILLKKNSKISYGENLLLAHEITMDLKKKEIYAACLKPRNKIKAKNKLQINIFNKKYFASDLRANLTSQKAKISDLFTTIETLLFRAKLFKKVSDEDYYAYQSSITTCKLPHPHYEIYAEKVKISENKKLITGPLFLKFNDTKTIGFFFGFLTWPDKKNGMLFPKYGGNSKKGIYIEHIGYYWNWKDLIDLQAYTNFYTGGEIDLATESFYKKRYLLEGSLNYTDKFGLLSNNQNYRSWSLKWDHLTIDNLNRNNLFFANVNLQNTKNAFSYKDNTTSQYTENYKSVKESSVRYINKLKLIPFYNLGLKISYSELEEQDSKTIDLILPSAMLYTDKIYPFREIKKNAISLINVKHSIEAKNKINANGNNLNVFNTKNWNEIFSHKRTGLKNLVDLSADFKIAYLALTPFFKNKNLYLFKFYRNANKHIWDYDTGVNLKTDLYNTFFYKKNRVIEAIRHQITPSISLNYNPNSFKKYIKENNEEKYAFDIPNRKESLILTIIIGNVLSYKNKDDKQKQIFIENISLESGYNFFEKRNPIQDLKFFEKMLLFRQVLILESTQVYDPYLFENKKGTKSQKLYIMKNGIIGHLKEGSIKITTNLSFNAIENNENPPTSNNAYVDSEGYVIFNIPLTLKLNYLYNYNSPMPSNKKVSKVLSIEPRISLSKNWSLTFETGYDFQRRQIAKKQTYVEITRDLHCWEMHFKYYPLANEQLFDFSIGVKPSMLDGIRHSRHNKTYTNV